MAANPAVPAPDLSFQTERTPTETIVRCSGRIVSATTQSLKTAVRPFFQDSKLVVLDLTGVNYIDSSGLGAIVGSTSQPERPAASSSSLISISASKKCSA